MVIPGIITGVLLAGAAVALGPLSRRRSVRALAVVACVAGVGLAIRSLVADHWTQMTPRPVLAFLLERAEPYPERPVVVGVPGPRIEPDPDFMHSDDRWERLLWHHQYGHAARAWYERVQATPPDRLRSLVPHARRMQELTKTAGGTRWVDGWPSSRAEARLRERAEADDAQAVRAMRVRSSPPGPHPPLRTATWAISELQYLETGTPEMRQGFVPPPMEVLEAIADAALAAGDREAVLYAIDRAAAIKSAGAQALLERLAVELASPAGAEGPPSGVLAFDADAPAALAQRLDRALRWRSSFARPETWAQAGVAAHGGGGGDAYDLPPVPRP